jgi:hypothetical protein
MVPRRRAAHQQEITAMTTTSRHGPSLPIAGTSFQLVPVRIEWEDFGRVIIHDYGVSDQGFHDHQMLGLHSEYPLTHPDFPDPKDLPVCREVKPEVAWTIRSPDGEGCYPVFWRQQDAVWMAEQLHAACPEVWALSGRDAQRAATPEGVPDWLGLVPPLLNAGCPRALLLGCRAYCEATGQLAPYRRGTEAAARQ